MPGISLILRQLHTLMATQKAEGQTDGPLLERFVSQRDEAAFAALLERHGPMVLGVCRRILHDEHRAEDAFQATFLVLVRKASSIRKQQSIASWLHGVALRLARNAKVDATRATQPDARNASRAAADVQAEISWQEAQKILDDELQRLPDNYRLPLVLCYLEGLTRDEAAAQLGWTANKRRGFLERGRDRLRSQLIRRGVTLSVAASATLLADTILAAAVPPLLAVATVHAAARFAAGTTLSACGISASVAVLTEGGLKMVASKTMTLILTLTLAFGVIGSGVGILAQRTEPAAAVAAHPKGVPPLAPVIERAPNAAEGAKENMLAVTIKPQKSRIRASEPFKVDLRVVNSSKSLQSFRAMIGSWHRHWFTSNERVLVSAWPGSEDEAIEVTLAPGEADEKTLPMIILAGKSLDKESFKLGFTPIGSKQTFWSNEVTVEVDQDKKGPRFVPVASYPSEDRAAEKRIRELLDAAKITFISVGSRGLTASVGEDKAKQARAILEKAVVAGTLTVQVLDALPMPKNLRAVRTDDKLRIEEDIASNEEVIVPVAGGLIRATDCELSIYRGKERVSHTGGTYTPPFDRTRAASKIPNPGESYEVELVVWWFETDAPHQPNWKPQSGGKYKVLVTRTLKLNVGPENSKSAVPPPNRWEKLLQNRELTAKQRAAYEQIANLHTVKLDQEDHRGAISVPSFVKNSKLPTDVLYAMGLDALPMLAEALDDETPTATVITARGGDVMLVKVWKVNEFAALLIVRIAGRDFVIGEFPKALDIRDIAQNPKEAPRFRKLVVAWHSKFATKTPTERTLADLTDPWFRNRFDAIIALGNGKVKEARAPIAARVDAYFADPNREVSSTTQWEMTYSALALGQIGDRASLPQVRRVCADMSHTMYMSYRPLDQGRWGRGSSLNENLFRAYDALTLLGQKDEAVTELTRLLATYGAEMEASTRKDYEERLNAAKGEAPKK